MLLFEFPINKSYEAFVLIPGDCHSLLLGTNEVPLNYPMREQKGHKI